jgi:hypothetical protein
MEYYDHDQGRVMAKHRCPRCRYAFRESEEVERSSYWKPLPEDHEGTWMVISIVLVVFGWFVLPWLLWGP